MNNDNKKWVQVTTNQVNYEFSLIPSNLPEFKLNGWKHAIFKMHDSFILMFGFLVMGIDILSITAMQSIFDLNIIEAGLGGILITALVCGPLFYIFTNVEMEYYMGLKKYYQDNSYDSFNIVEFYESNIKNKINVLNYYLSHGENTTYQQTLNNIKIS